MNILHIIFIAIAGACIGSFANVVIYRLPEGKSVVFPGSCCPSCGVPIKWYDNIPVLSYLILAGKCRNCRSRISLQYVIVELFTSLLIVLLWLKFGYTVSFLGYTVLTVSFIIISVIDFHLKIIPDELTLPFIAAGLLFSPLNPHLVRGGALMLYRILGSTLGIVCGVLFFYGIGFIGKKIFKKEALGGGDVKLAGVMGAFLGCRGLFFAVFIGSLIGSVISILLIYVLKKLKWGAYLPYGPFLCSGALIYILIVI